MKITNIVNILGYHLLYVRNTFPSVFFESIFNEAHTNTHPTHTCATHTRVHINKNYGQKFFGPFNRSQHFPMNLIMTKVNTVRKM